MASDLTVVSALGFSRAEALVKLLPLSGQREREKENGNGLTFEAMLMMPSRYVRIHKCKPRGIYDSGKVKFTRGGIGEACKEEKGGYKKGIWPQILSDGSVLQFVKKPTPRASHCRVMLVAGLVDFAMVVVGPTILRVVKGLVDLLLMVIEVDTFGGIGTDYDIEVVL
ncbi:hypothetical protein MRB53_018329 [Persea americana]|uniref:Uncharacterized protein n=1 Tax=Persea americana TaxID=3435 RepID=A0ACC2M7M1_PERAE|nr:hypothetical protein MRB53_018329 [Persea americana]